MLTDYSTTGKRLFVYNFIDDKGYNLKNGLNAENYILEESASLFPLLSRPGHAYFTGKPTSSSSDEFEPNASIFLVKLKK